MLKPWRLALLAVAAIAGAIAAWTWWSRDTSLQDLQRRGELHIGYALEAPYALLKPDGTPGGESPEVARELARRLGLKPVWVLADFDQLVPGVESGRFDVAAAGLFVTAERARRIAFTRPTLRVRPGWLVRRGAPQSLPAYAQATPSPAWRVAVVAGSVEEAALRPLAAPGTLIALPDARSAQLAVDSGAAEALALSLPTLRMMAAASGGRLAALPAGDGGGADLVALAVARDRPALRDAANAELDAYIGSPAHLAMLQTLGLGRDDLPDPLHAGHPPR